jgi:predicted dehydrogenase
MRQASAAEPERYTAAIIGHTGRGNYGHGLDELFLNRANIELLAVADADEKGRAKAVKKLKAPRSYADYREMLEKEKPQLVSVAPRQADQHRDMVMAALKTGAHVYCEKPFVTCPAESDELLAEASKRGLRIAVSHQMRMAPCVVKLKEAFTKGTFGDLVEMRGWGKQDRRAGGEDLIVLGTHVFDLMRLFAGNPEWCTARVLTKGRDITAADGRLVKDNVGPVAGDEVNAAFAFAHGVHATFTSRAAMRAIAGHWGLEVTGTKGVARILADIPPHVRTLKTAGWQGAKRTDEWQAFAEMDAKENFRTANARLVDDWLKAIEEKREPECSGSNGAWAVEMVIAIYRAALSGGRAKFPLTERSHPLATK